MEAEPCLKCNKPASPARRGECGNALKRRATTRILRGAYFHLATDPALAGFEKKVDQ